MENKDFITENAIKLFSKKGYEAAGVQELCQLSGITKPTLYYYFKSKAGVLEYIINTKANDHFSKLQTALTYNHDFIKGLTETLKTEITFALENPDFFDLHCILLNSPEGSEQKNLYMPMIVNIQKLFDDFFTASCNEFGNMRGKEILYSRLFQNNIISTSLLILKGQLNFSDELIFQIVHSLVYGMAN